MVQPAAVLPEHKCDNHKELSKSTQVYMCSGDLAVAAAGYWQNFLSEDQEKVARVLD